MLPRQPIKAERFFNIFFHPDTELGIPFAPLQQPGRQILAGFLRVPPIINPAQLLQAIIVSFARQVVERIAQEVNVAALPDCLGQCFLNRPAQAGMIVALVAAMLEMYVQGVSTRKVKTITEELCGHEFSSSTISRIVQKLDEELEQFARRRLEEPYPYLILDARYEKVREDGTVRSQAVLVAIGINWEGRRNILAVELASRESLSSWKDLLAGLRQRSLHGVEFVVSDEVGEPGT